MRIRLSRPGRRAIAGVLSFIFLFILFGTPSPIAAQPATPAGNGCVVANEPNDEVSTAVELGAGPVCASSENATGGQDLYRWTVEEGDTGSSWTMGTTTIPDQVSLIEVYRVETDTAGTVTAAAKLLSVTGGDDPAAGARDLFWSPGVYYIGVATSGPGSYRLSIEKGITLAAINDSGVHDSVATAYPEAGAFSLSGDRSATADVLAWTIDERGAAGHWTLTVQGPVGDKPRLTIADAAGTQLFAGTAGSDGRLILPDMGLNAATYFLTVASSSEAAAPYMLSASPGAPRSPQSEDEPNDTSGTGMTIEPIGDSTSITGRLATTDDSVDDVDTYKLNVDDTHAGRYLELRLLWGDGPSRKLCLSDAAGASLVCIEGDHGAAMHDIVLAKGTYTLAVTGTQDPDHPYVVKIDAKQRTIAGFEAEPNETQLQASKMIEAGDGSFAGSGRSATADSDFFSIEVAGSPQLWLIEVDGTAVGTVSLLDAAGNRVASRNGSTGLIQFFDIYLTPGKHWIQIQGAASLSGDYSVKATPLGPPDPQGELEPNDTLDQSQTIRLQEMRTGRIAEGIDTDVYRFSLQNETYVAFDLTSPPEGSLTMSVQDIGTTYAVVAASTPGEALSYVALLPAGDYSVAIAASIPNTALYHLRVEIADPFATADDLEPNDSVDQARPFPAELVLDGVSDLRSQRGDTDTYLLPTSLDGQQITIGTNPEALISLAAIDGGDVSMTLPVVTGTVPGSSRVSIPSGTRVYLTISGIGPYRVVIVPDGGTPVAIPANTPAASPIVSPAASPVAAGITMQLALGTTPVAAYWSEGQRVDGTLTIGNPSGEEQHLTLDSRVGNSRWRVEPGSSEITLKAGESATIAVVVHVAPDAWADQPIFVAIEAVNELNVRQASAMELVTPGRDATPLNSETQSPLPDAVLGGLDAAWTGLGATPVSADGQDPAVVAQLFDQLTNTGTGLLVDTGSLPQEYVIDLAGIDPVPVSGFILDPRGLNDLAPEAVKDFDIELSMDGVTFVPALSGSLSVVSTEHAFVLDKPVMARFARLRIRSAQFSTASSAHLGEWKVIAQPGWSPGTGDGGTPAASNVLAMGLDIGAFGRGGHVVAMQPQFDINTGLQGLVTADQQRQTLDVAPGTTVSWVIGFRDDRAAQLTGLTWVDPLGSDSAARFERVQIEVGLESPTGPWTSVGEWDLDRPGQPAFAFATPTWARFVRISGAVPGGGATPVADGGVIVKFTWEFPDSVAAIERAQDAQYRSILGEWGASSMSAIYERLVAPTAMALDPDAGDEPGNATLLPLGSRVTNTASTRTDEDWYRVEVPAGMGELTFTLTGDPTLDVTVALVTKEGATVAPRQKVDSPAQTTYVAMVTGGETYLLRVTQPPTSIVFAFDTSLSIGPFVTTVYQGLGQYAADVQPGKEVVNFLPFGDSLLLQQWEDDPYLLQGAIASYPRTAGSSDAEGSLMTAMDGLSDRDGSKAIVLITDAESSPTQEELDGLWSEFGTVKPRVFAIQIGGANGLDHSQDLMQDWATVNHGQYVYVRNQGEMDVAFDRAATTLRRPTVYSLSATASPPQATPTAVPTATPLPTPTLAPTPSPTQAPIPTPIATAVLRTGSLQVVAPTPVAGQATTFEVADNASIAIIFDTSGSMLQGLDGSTRADIAKQSLSQLVMETIPRGTNVSLRTFGDTPDSCDTRLVVPAGPLDPTSMAATIQNVPIVDLVRTPIGASLLQAAGDLGTSSGPKIVVLVTDGEETCGGDAEAAIRALIASGIDVHVNIVGFALDDVVLKATFASWAQIGNGRYIDAGNASELQSAVAEAVQPTYQVVDGSGAVVASGQVGGDPIVVAAGTYTVVVASNPQQRFPDVTITPDQTTTVQLQAIQSTRTGKGYGRWGQDGPMNGVLPGVSG
jgi:hypothetical protein